MPPPAPAGRTPHLIVVGGFAGAGKTTLSRRLSADLAIPRLGSDDFLHLVRESAARSGGAADPGWIAYDILYGLLENFLGLGLSVILDNNMGNDWRWRHVDAIVERNPAVRLLPIILSCPLDLCAERITQRHAADPAHELSADAIMAESRHTNKWTFVEQLERPDLHVVDATRPAATVYADVRRHVLSRLASDQ